MEQLQEPCSVVYQINIPKPPFLLPSLSFSCEILKYLVSSLAKAMETVLPKQHPVDTGRKKELRCKIFFTASFFILTLTLQFYSDNFPFPFCLLTLTALKNQIFLLFCYCLITPPTAAMEESDVAEPGMRPGEAFYSDRLPATISPGSSELSSDILTFLRGRRTQRHCKAPRIPTSWKCKRRCTSKHRK